MEGNDPDHRRMIRIISVPVGWAYYRREQKELEFHLAQPRFIVYIPSQVPFSIGIIKSGRWGIGMKVGRYLIVFVLLMSALIVFGDRGLVDNYRMTERMTALKKINHEMTLENIALKKTITLLRDNPSFIEMVARSELGMVKEGELVYRKAQ
jgi:cell division protein FtsB